METFVKRDATKVLASEVDPKFILGVANVLTFGATKYARGNWKLATEEDRDRLKDSLMRHIYAYLSGEVLDPETNQSHLYHATCNLMFLDNLDKQLSLMNQKQKCEEEHE